MSAIDDKYHIKIGDLGLILARRDRANDHIYARDEAPAFVNKFSSGDPNYRDSTFFPHWAQLDWINGFDQEFFDDSAKFYRSSGLDTTDRTKLKLEEAFNSAGQVKAGANVVSAGTLPGSQNWWNTGYSYRQQITITAPASQSLPSGYAVKTTINTSTLEGAGKVQADRDDWRIVYFNGASWIDLTRDYKGASETWFALQAQIPAGASDNNYYAYYGNASEATNKQPTTEAQWVSVYGQPSDDASTQLLALLEETSGTFADSSASHANTGTGSGGVTYNTAGKQGASAQFDGVNDVIDFGNDSSLQITGSLTVEFFIYLLSTPGTTRTIASKSNFSTQKSWSVSVNSSRKIDFVLSETGSGSKTANGNTALALNTWYHVACQFNQAGGTQQIYVNNVLDGSATGTLPTALFNSSQNVKLGGNSSEGFVNARIDGFRISNVARTSWPHGAVTSDPTVNVGSEVSQASANSTGGAKVFVGLNDGSIYQWDGSTTWTERFNVRSMTWYDDVSQADDARAVGDEAGTEYAVGQSFQLPAVAKIKSVQVYIKKNLGTPGDITVRLETNVASKPSGTLVDANLTGTINSASVSSSYGWVTVDFPVAVNLSASTTYWIVLKTAPASNNNSYRWGCDVTSSTYASGNDAFSTDGGSTWTASTNDMMFRVLAESCPANTLGNAVFSNTTYLYAGGGNPDSNNDGSARLYRSTDGTTWSLVTTLTGGVTSSILSMCYYNSELYLGTGPEARVFKSSDGTTFSLTKDINEPNMPGYVYAMVVYNQSLFVGGGHPEKYRNSNTQGFLFRYDGTDWSNVYPFDFTVIKSLAVYDSLLFIGTNQKRLYVYNTSSVDKLFEFPWAVSINSMASYNDKLAIALGPTDPLSTTGQESVYLFDRNGLHKAFSNTATSYNCLLPYNNSLLAGTSADGYVYRTITGSYVSTGYLQSSYFEAQLPSVDKLFRELTIQYDALPVGSSILVEYRTDESSGWTTLGIASTSGSTESTFTFAVNIYAKKISLKYTFSTSDTAYTPTLRKSILKYVLTPDFKYIWKMTVVCPDEMIWLDDTQPVSTLNGAVVAGDTSITLADTNGFPDPNGSTIYATVVDQDGNENRFTYTGKTSTTLTGIPTAGDFALTTHGASEVGVTTVKILGRDMHKSLLELKKAKKFYTLTDIDGNEYTVFFHSYQTDGWVIDPNAGRGNLENEVPITLLEA